MESIEKLRELAADINSAEIIDHLDVVGKFVFRSEWLDSWHKAFDAACDEIESEIAERYMELPLDADGVPIRPREEVSTGMGDDGPIGHLEYWYPNHWVAVIEYKPGRFTRYDPAAIRHVKPRTVEDVLRDYACDFADSSGPDYDEEITQRYADEIRELLGVSNGDERADELEAEIHERAAFIRELLGVSE